MPEILTTQKYPALSQLILCTGESCLGKKVQDAEAATDHKMLLLDTWKKDYLWRVCHISLSDCLGPCDMATNAVLLKDEALVDRALARLNLTALAGQEYETLSGGEKQRTLIARAVAQEAKLLILDETTNHLDIRYQLEVLELLRSLQLPVLVALHDLNLAAATCREIMLIAGGQLQAAGPPKEVLTARLIEEVYDVRATIFQDTLGIKHISFSLGSGPLDSL